MGRPNLIDELISSSANFDLSRRATILARITDLFISGRSCYDEQQIVLFDDLLVRLSEQVEVLARIMLSERLASVSNPPRKIINTLANDDHLAAALPVLSACDDLDEITLIKVAKRRDQDRLYAIAARKGISEAVTDVVADLGEIPVLQSLLKNPGAVLGENAYASILKSCALDAELASTLWLRHSVPRHHLVKLFIDASDAARIKLENLDPKQSATIRKIISEVSNDFQKKARNGSGEYQEAIYRIKQLNSLGKLSGNAVREFALKDKFDDLAVALSTMCDLPIEVVERGLIQDRSEVIVVIAKAAGLDWDTTKAILQTEARRGSKSQQYLDLELANFTKLTVPTAKKAVAFYRLRARSQSEKNAIASKTRPEIKNSKPPNVTPASAQTPAQASGGLDDPTNQSSSNSSGSSSGPSSGVGSCSAGGSR